MTVNVPRWRVPYFRDLRSSAGGGDPDLRDFSRWRTVVFGRFSSDCLRICLLQVLKSRRSSYADRRLEIPQNTQQTSAPDLWHPCMKNVAGYVLLDITGIFYS